jgi:hypothetical protein
MNKRAIEWLKRWLDQNINSIDVGVDYLRAIELSDKCRVAAEFEGVAIEDVTRETVLECIVFNAALNRRMTAQQI